MRKFFPLAVLLVAACGLAAAQVRVTATYNYPTLPGTALDTVLNGLKSIRAAAFANDVDGDGRREIAVTNYSGNGRVHIFEAAGNDSMRLVWTSPNLTPAGGGSTPRAVIFGSLDNDSRQEVIFQLNNGGIYIFEWDGVNGSDNYGTVPSQVIGSGILSGVSGNAEYMEIGNPDGDASNELLVAYNSAPNENDKYYVISADGDWSTGDPGFSSFTVEYAGQRTALNAWGLAGGTPYAMIQANFDGTGNKEVLIHNWNFKNVVPMRVTGANTYVLPDTTTGRDNLFLSAPDDNVALFGGMAYDIDNDGREEVYLPTYPGVPGGPGAGIVHMISYNTGQPTTQIDSTNVTRLDFASVTGTKDLFGYGWGDIDNDGRRNLYFSTSWNTNVVTAEFQGGDKRNPANWTFGLVYAGDSTIVTAVTYRDSLGRRDTLRAVDPSFVSKMVARNTDFDNDGREDIILPYQALSDSVTIRRLTWNSGLAKYDSVLSRVVNPKRWGIRVVERTTGTGVEGKDITIITPDDYRLEQNYPNPFNPATTLRYYLPVASRITIRVYDVLGQEVRTLVNNEERPSGEWTVTWDGRDSRGVPSVSGTYFTTMTFGNYSKTVKMMLVK